MGVGLWLKISKITERTSLPICHIIHNPFVLDEMRFDMTQMILVIAQDMFMQEALGDLLQHEGFASVMAKDRTEGLHVFRQRQDEVALVVLDVNATNQVDFTLYDDLQAVNPFVKVLVSTSYDEREVKRRYREKVPFQVLYKPYDAQLFLDTVSRMRA